MNSYNNKKVMCRILEETRFAYRISSENDHLNADYAEYASAQALEDFRHAFGEPDMSHEQLCRMLRQAASKERRRQCKTPWAMFMANFIERNGANTGHINR